MSAGQASDVTSQNERAAFLVPGLAFGLAAALINNVVLVPVYGTLTLHLGSAVALLCLLLNGYWAGLLAGLLSGCGLAFALKAPLIILPQIMEVGLIGLLVIRRWPLLAAALLYWAVVGLPSYYLLARFNARVPDDYFLIAVIKQAINGMFSASIAAGLHLVFSHLQQRRGGKQREPVLYEQVLSLAMVCLVLPSLLLSLILTNRSVATFTGELDLRLTQKAASYARLVDDYIGHHRAAVVYLAEIASSDTNVDLRPALSGMQRRYPGFLTMLVSDEAGNIIFGAPETFYKRLIGATENAPNISDRDYFLTPAQTGQPFVSRAFQGRGFGEDPIVAISAPTFDTRNRFTGIVEGSLDLPNFGRLQGDNSYANEAVIVLDQTGRIVFSSPGLQLEPLSRFEPEVSTRYTSVRAQQLVIDGERYLHKSSEIESGWIVHALSRTDVVNQLIRRDMLLLGASLATLIVIFLLISRRIARGIARPLYELTRQVSLGIDAPIRLSERGAKSPEIGGLADALESARVLSANFQKRLTEEVAHKTQALEAANSALEQLAVEDALTGLLNRRGFVDQAHKVLQLAARESHRVAVILIDVDHFKQVNDVYGHPAGDECLRRLASQLREAFGRSTDIVARTGGEEFVVLTLGGDCQTHLERLEALRQSFARTPTRVNEGDDITSTFSAGFLCGTGTAGLTVDDLLAATDKLLYESKHAGRNRTTARIIADAASVAGSPD